MHASFPISCREYLWLSTLCLGYAVLTFCIYLFHIAFPNHTSGLDLGVYLQMLWSVVHLGEAINTSIFNTPMRWFSFHFNPLVVLLGMPAIWLDSLWWLNALQSILQASAGLPIYLLARNKGQTHRNALLWVTVLFLNPFYFNASLWDFHETAIACPLIAWMCYSLLCRRWVIYWAAGCLLLLVKEHYGITLAAAGLAWYFQHHEKRRGLTLFLLGIAGFLMVVFVLMPAFGDMLHPMLTADRNGRYSWLVHPEFWEWNFFSQLLISNLLYAVSLLAWFFFLPLGYITPLLLGGADLAANVLADNSMMRNIYSYHSAALIPTLVASCILAQPRLTKAVRLPGYLACFAALGLCIFSIPAVQMKYRTSGGQWGMDNQIAEIKKQIQNDDRILTQNNIGAHFAQRQHLYLLPPYLEGGRKIKGNDVDVIITYERYPFTDTEWTFFTNPHDYTRYQSALERINSLDCFDIIYSDGPWRLRRRNGKICAPVSLTD